MAANQQVEVIIDTREGETEGSKHPPASHLQSRVEQKCPF